MADRDLSKEGSFKKKASRVFAGIVGLILIVVLFWFARFAKVQSQSFDDATGAVSMRTTYVGLFHRTKVYRYSAADKQWLEKDGDDWVPIRGTHTLP